ncbi:MAG: S8 family peptidase, partial [Anaerolineae bacterium]|nr:S8 family peptidase [Anaerolineae bacterium]
SVYDAIRAAREAGILVITSAGNNNDEAYVSWTYSSTVNFTIQASAGDTVSLSWNDWPVAPNNGGTAENFQLTISGVASVNRSSNPNGDPGVQLTFPSNDSYTVTVTRQGGNSSSDYLQLQTTGQITNNNGGLTPNTTSTMGRPGDSTYALSVGAVCSSQEGNYPILDDSSRGPLYTSGGNLPPTTPGNDRATVKPDLVGLSHISISGDQVSTPCNALGTDGFNGTSASAAHVAGMAALLISNTNTSMDLFDSGANAANALQNYLQTHAVSLIGLTSLNGFDNTYGAGVAVLGNPTYDLTQISKPGQVNGLPGTTYYVGGRAISAGTMNPGQNGSFANPYLSLRRAIEAATAGDSIVLFPGEYVTGIDVPKSVGIYAYNQFGNGADSVFRTNNSFEGNAGLFVTAEDVIIDGFRFQPSDPEGLSDCCGEVFPRATAVEFRDVTSGILRNSNFSNFDTAVPVSVVNSPGVQIASNIFDNIDGGSLFGAALRILDSESANSSNPVLVEHNEFTGNFTQRITQDLQLEAIVNVEESAVDFVGNFFYNNNSESVVRINNTDNPGAASGGTVGTSMVNFYSNIFVGNQRGPIVYARIGRRLRFINNTVVNNTGNGGSTGNPHLGLIQRDNPQSAGTGWSHVSGDVNGNWDVHNNIFYDNFNGASTLKIVDEGGGSDDTLNSFCVSLGSSSNTGMSNNWIFDSGVVANSTAAGDCANAMVNGSGQAVNNHILNTDLMNEFVNAVPPYPSEPNGYRLRQTAPGIDAANPSVPNTTNDFTGINPRVVDGGPDIGAYELTPLQAMPITANRVEDTFNQLGDQTGAFAIDLSVGAVGGFEPYTFAVNTYPANYSTSVTDPCGGLGVIVQGTRALYCPPQHFYNNGTPFGTSDDVVFEYKVTDTFGGTATAEVTVNIDPVNDALLTAGSALTYNFVTEGNKPFNFRLRPFVRFGNFRFSEAGDPTRGNQADYPFDYTFVNLDTTEPGYNPNLFGADANASKAYLTAQIAAAAADGLITLSPQPGELGFLTFTYTVTDSRGGSVTNKIRLEVTGLLPDSGLHDDSSLNFSYSGGWSPLYSEGNINNTLHVAQGSGDTATFEFVAETFTLYMQSDNRGGNWQLKLDGGAPLNWTTSNGESTATAGIVTCSTRANTSGNRISNLDRARNMYTVTCRNLRDGESHTIDIVTVDSRRKVQIDAISLNFDGSPLQPGFHEVNEANILPYFPGWSLFSDKKASNDVALRTTSTGQIQFSFTGTGIAIGTGLEKDGASYSICVTPEGGSEVCQNFNNSNGAPRRGTSFGVYHPFFGYNPEGEHTVRLVINSIPNGGRMMIDSITVFNQQPTAPLPFGTTEDDNIGPIIFSNGADDSWSFNTNDRKSSNRSLTSIARRVNNIGPFISFEVPANANRVLWFRKSSRRDSTQVMICVDRAQGETANNHCKSIDLRSVPNPYSILESQFTGGWGTGFGDDNTHTIEIFSLENASFNLDKVQVFNTSTPLGPSFYEEFNLDGNNSVYGYFQSDSDGNALGDQDVNSIYDSTTRRASGSAVKRTSQLGAGAFFQMVGTGFSVGFTRDGSAGNVEICWVSGHTNDIAAIRAGTCRTYNNNGRTFYQMERSIVGLSSTPQDYSVVVRNVSGRMDFDTLTIYDELPAESLDTHGYRYETSYDDRDLDDLFLYYGDGWRTKLTPQASDSSNDEINKSIGAGIVFETNGVDTVEIIRSVGKRNAWVQVCVDGMSCRNFAGDADPVVAHLSDTNPHQISVTTITEGKFTLDAVDVYDSNNPLVPGFYEDTYPLLKFDNSWGINSDRGFSDRSAQQTSTTNGTLLFHVNAEWFLLGAQVTQANQMQICYVSGIETNANNVNSNCQTWPSSALGGVQDYSRSLGSNGDYTIRVRNKAAETLLVDYVYTTVSTTPLTQGYFEETHPVLVAGRQGAGWVTTTGSNYSGGAAVQTSTAGDRMLFQVNGTGFAIGTVMNSNGGDMLVCYEAGAISGFASDGSDIDANCYTYNNNQRSNSFTTSRTVNGLTNGSYSVRIQNVSGLLQVDYVQVFNDTLTTLTAPGVYNEDAGLTVDQPYLSLLPDERWKQVSGRNARNYSGSSYMTVVDGRDRASNKYAGPIATLRVQVPADPDGAGSEVGRATVILDTGPTSKRNSSQLLVCANNVNTSACQVRNMTQNQYHTMTFTNNTASPVTRVITYRAITPGSFNIDGYLLITNNTLQEGLYDDFLMSDNGIINLDGTWALPPERGTKNRRAFGGTQVGTSQNNAVLSFDFTGTGFAIFTQQSTKGIDFRLCYVLKSEFTTWTAPNVTCSNRTTDISRGKIDSFGHTVYGLQSNTYKVRLLVNDNSIDSRRDNLYVDAVAIFGDVTGSNALQPGMYDNANLANNHADAVRFAPVPFWSMSTTKNGPPRGPWLSTQHVASSVGALMQVYLEGNALTIYQAADRKSSSWVQVCLVIPNTEDELVCTNYSQNSRKSAYFTPVMIYGLGDGEHEVILENRDTRKFNVDALQVIP